MKLIVKNLMVVLNQDSLKTRLMPNNIYNQRPNKDTIINTPPINE